MVHTDEPGERRAGGAVSAGSRPDDVPRPGENHPPRVLPAGVRRFAQALRQPPGTLLTLANGCDEAGDRDICVPKKRVTRYDWVSTSNLTAAQG